MKLWSHPGLCVSVRDWATAQPFDLLRCIGITALGANKESSCLRIKCQNHACVTPWSSATASSRVRFCLCIWLHKQILQCFDWSCLNRGTRQRGKQGGEKVGRLENTLIFHPGTSLHVAVEVRQAFLLCYVWNDCHMQHVNPTVRS